MIHKPEAIDHYNFKSSDKLLLDTNVWMYVYGPQRPNDKDVIVYSEAVKNIFQARSCIYINALIISEFINSYARSKWKHLAPELKDFKKFRSRHDFKNVAQEIAGATKQVLKNCIRIEDDFDSLPIDNLIEEYASGDFDFNDQILSLLCEKQALKLVTHDGDFKGCKIPVITANKRLLN